MNENINILVVEDDNTINNMLKTILEKEKYKVAQAFSGTEALLYAKHQEFDLIMLDLMLPGLSGEEVLKEIRNGKEMPVIVISAKMDKESKIQLLRLGADDYITKPFDIDEVVARVFSNLRRYKDFSKVEEKTSVVVHGDLRMDLESKEVKVDGKGVNLTAREFSILKLLLENPNKVFSKANLFQSVWEDDYFGDENTVNVHMSNLRSKLSKVSPGKDYIQTVWGMGYKLI